VWACPVCSNKIATRRAEEISTAVRRWEELGGKCVLVTLTMRHKKGQQLATLWEALSYAWSKTTSGAGWMSDQQLNGSDIAGKQRIGWVKAVEVTFGENGWHVHVHALLFLRGDFDSQGIGTSMFQRWREALIRKDLDAPIATKGGLDIRPVDSNTEALGGYFNKATYDGALIAGFEMARGAQKMGRKGGRTPFQMWLNVCENLDNADDIAAQLEAVSDKKRWHVYEQASKGRRQITWSRGLREFLALESEITDEDIASEDMSTAETVVNAHYVNHEFAILRRNLPRVLRAAEVWYMDEYLPAIMVDPGFAEAWRRSWFKERLWDRERKPGINKG